MTDPSATEARIKGVSGAGRVAPAAASPSVAAGRNPYASEAICVGCGRDIMRYWSDGVQSPWKHWVEPVPDGHAARPA